MKFRDFLKRWQQAELPIEEKVLRDLKQGKHYDTGKVWEEGTLANLEKLDRLIITLLRILRRENVQIGQVYTSDLINKLSKLVGQKDSLLQRSHTAQLSEIEALGPEEWFREFRIEIDHLNEKLKVLVKDIEILDKKLTRRRVLRVAALGAGMTLAPSPAYGYQSTGAPPSPMPSMQAQSGIESNYSSEVVIDALNYACDIMEMWGEYRSLKRYKEGFCSAWGPHGDYTQFNMTAAGFEWQDLTNLEKYDEERKAAMGENHLTDRHVSFSERALVTISSLNGRNKAGIKVYALKHFPGGPPEINATHYGPYPINGDLEEFIAGHSKAFLYAIKARALKAVMTSHASYPGMENDLHKLYPDIPELSGFKPLRPATLSPLINIGFLRRYAGFEGLVISDSMTMEAITSYADEAVNDPSFNKVFEGYEFEETWHKRNFLTFVLSMYAGINWTLDLQIEMIIGHLSRYYDKDPIFRGYVDDSIKKTLELAYKECGSPSERRFSQNELTVPQKIMMIEQRTAPKAGIKSVSKLKNCEDIWDRGGQIHILFRRAFLAKLTGQRFIIGPVKEDDKEFKILQNRLNKKLEWGRLIPFYEINDERFFELHDKMRDNREWEALNPYYEYVAKSRYHAS